jgi:hypothetical protein
VRHIQAIARMQPAGRARHSESLGASAARIVDSFTKRTSDFHVPSADASPCSKSWQGVSNTGLALPSVRLGQLRIIHTAARKF